MLGRAKQGSGKSRVQGGGWRGLSQESEHREEIRTLLGICIFLMMSDGEHLSMYLSAMCTSSLKSFYAVPLLSFKWIVEIFFY